MKPIFHTDRLFQESKLTFVSREVTNTGVEQSENPEQKERDSVQENSQRAREQLANNVLKANATRAFQEYESLKNNQELKTLAERMSEREYTDEEMANPNFSAEERRAAEYLQAISQKLEVIKMSLMQAAVKDIPGRFSQDQLITKMLDIADEWGISQEAKNELKQLMTTQEAFYEAQKARLGADFENLHPQEQLQRVIEKFDLKGEVPKDVRNQLSAMGLNMPPGLTFQALQGPAENIVKNSSLARGSFLMKAAGGIAGIWVVTGALANIIMPAFGLTMKIATNINKPKEVGKIIKEAWGKKGQFFKRMMFMGAVTGGAAIALSDNPMQAVQDMRNAAANTLRRGYEGAVAGGREAIDRVRGRTPTLQIIAALDAVDANKDILSANTDRNKLLLREFYSESNNFNFSKLNDITSAQQLTRLKELSIGNATMNEEVRRVYERGQQRLEAAHAYIQGLHEFARRYQVSNADIQQMKEGDLANLLVGKYNSMQPQERSLMSRVTQGVSDAYESTIGPNVRGVARGVATNAVNIFNVAWNNVIRNRDTGYAQVNRGQNIPEVPETEVRVPQTIVPAKEELERAGFKVPGTIMEQDPYKNDAPKVFAVLLAHIRRIQNPNAFTRTSQ